MPPVSMTVIDAVLLLLIYLYTHGIFTSGNLQKHEDGTSIDCDLLQMCD